MGGLFGFGVFLFTGRTNGRSSVLHSRGGCKTACPSLYSLINIFTHFRGVIEVLLFPLLADGALVLEDKVHL